MATIDLRKYPYDTAVRYYDNNGVDQLRQIQLSLDPVDSPIWFYFRSDVAGYPQNIIYAELILAAGSSNISPFNPAVVLDGASYTIWGVTFTARDNPIEQTDWFSCNGTAGSSQRSAQSLASAINTNSLLNWRFSASVYRPSGTSGFQVRVRARYAGTIYNLIVGTDVIQNAVTSYGSIASVNNNRGMRLQNYNYGCWIDIIAVTENGVPVEWGREPDPTIATELVVASLEQRWNSTNRFAFDVSTILKSLISIPLPNVKITSNNLFAGFNNATGQFPIISYKIRYGEFFNGGSTIPIGVPPTYYPTDPTIKTVRRYTVGETYLRWACRGAFKSYIDPPQFAYKWVRFYYNGTTANSNRRIGEFLNYIDKLWFHGALTNMPQFKIRKRWGYNSNGADLVGGEPPEYLWFYLHHDRGDVINGRTFQLQTKYRLSDGSISVTTDVDVFPQQQGVSNLYYIDVSHKVLASFSAIDQFTPTLRIVETEHILQELLPAGARDVIFKVVYNVDTNMQPTSEYKKLYFINTYGVLDQFEFEGVQEEDLDIDLSKSLTRTQLAPEQGRTIVASNNWFRDKQRATTYKVEAEKSFTIQTGWVDRDHYNWLQELCTSPQIYLRVKDTLEAQGPPAQLLPTAGDLINTQQYKDFMQAISIKSIDWKYDSLTDMFNLVIEYIESQEINTISLY